MAVSQNVSNLPVARQSCDMVKKAWNVARMTAQEQAWQSCRMTVDEMPLRFWGRMDKFFTQSVQLLLQQVMRLEESRSPHLQGNADQVNSLWLIASAC